MNDTAVVQFELPFWNYREGTERGKEISGISRLPGWVPQQYKVAGSK